MFTNRNLQVALALALALFLVRMTVPAHFLLTGDPAHGNSPILSDPAAEPIRERDELSTRTEPGAQDWPMFCHNVEHTANTAADPPLRADPLWTFDMNKLEPSVEGDIYSTPIVVGERVFACSMNQYIVCLDIDTGTNEWDLWLRGEIASTPAYHDGSLYVGAGDKLWKINATSGDGQAIYTANNKIYSSPAVYNDTIFFGTNFNNSMFLAVRDNGTELWNISFGPSLRGTPASPAIHNGTVYVGCDNGLILAMDHDGLSDGNQGIVTDEINTSADIIWSLDAGSPVLSSPTVIPGAVIFSTFNSSGSNRIFALDPDTGHELWNRSMSSRIQSTAAYDPTLDLLFVGTFGGGMLALDANDGTLEWSFDTDGSIQSSPAVADGKIFFGGFDRRIWAVDAAGNGDGTTDEVWNYTTGKVIHSSPAISRGRLFIGSDDDRLYCIGAPDFVVSPADITFDDGEPFAGENITVRVNITNRGTVAAEAETLVTAYDLGNRTHLIGTARAYLAAGSGSTLSLNWTVADNPSRIWFVRAELSAPGMEEAPAGNMAETRLDFRRENFDQWPMVGGGPSHTGYDPDGTFTNRTLWKKILPSAPLSPIIYKDRAVIADASGNVCSIYIGTGVTSWKIELGGSCELAPAAGFGKVFVPLEGRLTALDIDGFEDGNDGTTAEQAVDIGDGDICWSAPIPTKAASPPTAANGTVIIACGQRLLALDEDDGSELFNVTLPGPAGGGSPTVRNERIYVGGSDGRVFCLNRFDGRLIWTHDPPGNPPLDVPVTALPGIIVFPAGNAMIAFDPDTRTQQWSVPTATGITTPASYSETTGMVFFGTEGGDIYGVSGSSGQVNVSYSTGEAVSTFISIGGDILYFGTGNDTVRAFSISKNADEPIPRWSFETASTLAPSLAVSGYVVASARDGTVYCFGAPNKIPVPRISKPSFGDFFLAGDEVELNASYSSDGDGDRLEYIWTRDRDHELYRGFDPTATVVFTTPGEHNITLTVDDAQGGSASTWTHVTVYDRKLLGREVGDDASNSSVNVRVMVGGDAPNMTLLYGENPGNVTGRDLGIFLNLSLYGVKLTEWIELSVAYDAAKGPFGLNESFLSFYYYTASGWVRVETNVMAGEDTATANLTSLPFTYAASNSTLLALGTFSNANPVLSSPAVAPAEGPVDGDFNLSVVYTDADNDFPDHVRLVIDGAMKYYMRPVSPGDLDVRDGKAYYYVIDGLGIGNHSYHFEAHDRTTGARIYPLENISALDTRPVARIAGPAAGTRFTTGETITLDGTGSADPDGDVLTYGWVIEKLSPADPPYLRNLSSNETGTKLVLTVAGTYRITLTVSDGHGHVSLPVEVEITVENASVANGGTGKNAGLLYAMGGAIALVVLLVVLFLLFGRKGGKERGTGREDAVKVDVEGAMEGGMEGAMEEGVVDREVVDGGKMQDAPGKDGQTPLGGAEGTTSTDERIEGTDEDELVCIGCGGSVSAVDKTCPRCGEELVVEDVEALSAGDGKREIEVDVLLDDEDLLDEDVEEAGKAGENPADEGITTPGIDPDDEDLLDEEA